MTDDARRIDDPPKRLPAKAVESVSRNAAFEAKVDIPRENN